MLSIKSKRLEHRKADMIVESSIIWVDGDIRVINSKIYCELSGNDT